MNKTLMFLQADMHRAINSGQRDITVSILDLKELLGAVEAASAKERNEKCGILFGFVRMETLSEMRSGKALYLTIRRKKNSEYGMPVYCDPFPAHSVDAIAKPGENEVSQNSD